MRHDRIRLALVALCLTLAPSDSAAADDTDDADWSFGLQLQAGWSTQSANVRADIPAFILLAPGTIRVSEDRDLEGASGEIRARVWFPIRLAGAQPWLDAGYRHPFSGQKETVAGFASDPDAFFPGDPGLGKILRVEFEGSWSARLGFDFDTELIGRRLTLAPVFGWEIARYDARLISRNSFLTPFFPPGGPTHQGDWFNFLDLGLELPGTPLVERERFSIDFTVGGNYLFSLAGKEQVRPDENQGVFGESRYRPGGQFRVNGGLLLRF